LLLVGKILLIGTIASYGVVALSRGDEARKGPRGVPFAPVALIVAGLAAAAFLIRRSRRDD